MAIGVTVAREEDISHFFVRLSILKECGYLGHGLATIVAIPLWPRLSRNLFRASE